MKLLLGPHQVIVHIDVLQILAHFTQHQADQLESGGIILGKIISNEIHIRKLSVPTQLDKATRTSFERHYLSAQIVIDYEFYNSGKQMVYLGEWHTHPEKVPTPSHVDCTMIAKQYKATIRRTDFLLLFIQGTEALYTGLYNGKELLTNKD